MFFALWQVLLAAWVVSAATPTRTLSKRQDGSPLRFVTTENGQFKYLGNDLDFVGTNAYWLAALNSEEDIDYTLGNISAAGIKVVRTWAFNDVEQIPENGTWFQLIANGTTSINNGTNGLQKLDTVVRLAEKHGLFLLLSLTNNWNPRPLFDLPNGGGVIQGRDVTPGTNNTLPRNTLSNDYGGMDVYVREFGDPRHDDFYTNEKILDVFLNYTTQVVSRYVDNTGVFAWELANDPRCNSTLPSTNGCTPKTITRWHSRVAQHIKSIDPNHLVASGNQGFFCVGCPKLFPRVVVPPPQTSAGPGQRRRTLKPMTKRSVLAERRQLWKNNLAKRAEVGGGIRIRGRWQSRSTKRQFDQNLGPAFDGSLGVDSEDIINIPQIGFGSFQLFPDQNTYGPDDPNLSTIDNIVQSGDQWIRSHAALGQLFNKPVTLNGFGLVTQPNAPSFIPFNATQAPFGPDNFTPPPGTQPFGITDSQRDQAYSTWLQTGLQAGLKGMLQYQWSQGNLSVADGTVVSQAVDGTTTSPIVPGTGVSPNDGYGIQGIGQADVVATIQQASQDFGAD